MRARSSYYYQSKGESAENLHLMRLLDEQYTRTPFYGIRRMTAWLQTQGYEINHKRVERLMRTMGLEAIYPKPRLSQPGMNQTIYPYLLRGLSIEHTNQVWSTDITYIRLAQGFVYLAAVIDWFSRYVLSWELSNGWTRTRLRQHFCREIVAQCEMGGGLSQRLPDGERSHLQSPRLFHVLQSRALASGSGLSNTGSCLYGAMKGEDLPPGWLTLTICL